jgi:hypothetical protein
MKRMRIAGVVAALAAAVVFPAVASATPPTREEMPVDTVDVFAGPDSPCPFDVTLTGSGVVTMTTFYDAAGTPVMATVHGALIHTISSRYRTLVTNGPAPVHLDLTSGETVVTGNELSFHVPGAGIVFGQAGRLVVGPDGSELSFTGRSIVDAPSLCAALGP